jgi:ubiquinone/menaquinone biosynthesis C-methylase UbiE
VIEEGVQERYVANRDARRFLPFLLPYVSPGMDVLDVGCGVGSIALDLAPALAPGRVVGIDADSEQIETARRSAAERGIENIEFVTSSVYELPFAEATFDVVYANAVLMYVRDQVRALAEMRRVLRPAGLAAVIDDDLGRSFDSLHDCSSALSHTRAGTLVTRGACARSCWKPGLRARKELRTRQRSTATSRPRAGSRSSLLGCSLRRAWPA